MGRDASAARGRGALVLGCRGATLGARRLRRGELLGLARRPARRCSASRASRRRHRLARRRPTRGLEPVDGRVGGRTAAGRGGRGSPASSACQSTAARSAADPRGLRVGAGSQGGRPFVCREQASGLGCPTPAPMSMACCRMITAATWSTMGRWLRLDFPEARSACCAHTVESRSSTSRTGDADAAASRAANARASVGRGVSRRPRARAAARPRARSRRTPRRARGCARTSASPSAARGTVSTGVGEQPAGVAARDADAGRADVDAEPHALAHARSPAELVGCTASSAAGIADDVAAAALREVVACRRRRRRGPRPSPSRARRPSRPRSRAAGVGRDDHDGLAADLGRRARRRMPRRRAARARRSRASAGRRPSRAVPTSSATSEHVARCARRSPRAPGRGR